MRNKCELVIIENFFEPCLLYLLLKKPSYGYELNKQLNNECLCKSNIGNLYRCLNRLVKSKKISKQIMTSKIGPKKIIYQITTDGKKLLEIWIENLNKQKNILDKLIKNYKKLI